jgi:uncharacterized protein YjbJ (UPF0337 family)
MLGRPSWGAAGAGVGCARNARPISTGWNNSRGVALIRQSVRFDDGSDVAASSGSQQQEEQPMNWDRIEGNWKEFKGKARQQWGKLTDDDVEFVEGKRTELAGRIQQRYGVARDEAERQIETWMKQIH